jgi:hypothetical protein
MRTSMISFLWLLTVASLLLSPPTMALATESRLKLDGGTPMVHGGSCDPGDQNLLGGISLMLLVNHYADQPRKARSEGWPEGYSLEATLDLPPDSPFVATVGLIEQLSPVPYLSRMNRSVDKQLRGDSAAQYVRTREDLRELNSKHFVLHVPAELVGHWLSFRAQYRSQSIELRSNTLGPLRVIAPCNGDDAARICLSEIDAACDMGNDDGALAIADSMLANGLTNAAAWDLASRAAWRLGRHDKELIFFDKLYQDYGALSVDMSGKPLGPGSPGIEQIYESRRASILQAIARQQQQR